MALVTPALAEVRVILPSAIAADPALINLRRQMLAGARLSDVQLRRLADAGEGLAAARFAQRLEARADPAVLDDAAHYYSIAVYVDREFALPRLLSVLRRPGLEIAPRRLKAIRQVLDNQVKLQNPIAAVGLANLLMRGQPFGQDIPGARDLLRIAAEAGDTDAAIRLAVSYIQGAPGLPPNPGAARDALALAMASPDPGVQSMAMALARNLPPGPPMRSDLAPATPTLRPLARPLTLMLAKATSEGPAP